MVKLLHPHLGISTEVQVPRMHSLVVHPRPRHVPSEHQGRMLTAADTKGDVVVKLYSTEGIMNSLIVTRRKVSGTLLT